MSLQQQHLLQRIGQYFPCKTPLIWLLTYVLETLHKAEPQPTASKCSPSQQSSFPIYRLICTLISWAEWLWRTIIWFQIWLGFINMPILHLVVITVFCSLNQKVQKESIISMKSMSNTLNRLKDMLLFKKKRIPSDWTRQFRLRNKSWKSKEYPQMLHISVDFHST